VKRFIDERGEVPPFFDDLDRGKTFCEDPLVPLGKKIKSKICFFYLNNSEPTGDHVE